MQGPIFHGAIDVAPGVHALASTLPVPGLGALHDNAYLLEAEEPVLIDAGVGALADQTIAALAGRIAPADLRYIWLTHCDPDHVGALEQLLELAPQARVVTNYLGMGKLTMRVPVAPERFYLINPGRSLDVGGRELRAVALPSYDAPETMGVFDSRARALFSSDCFGALVSEQEAAASVESVDALAPQRLRDGMITWTTVDAPWLRHVDPTAFRVSLRALEALGPDIVLGSHLPPARRCFTRLCDDLEGTRHAPAFEGPDQEALEAMLAVA